MRVRLFCAGLAGLAGLLHGASALGQCTKDTECKGERICEAGTCTWPTPSQPSASAGAAAPAPAPAPAPAEDSGAAPPERAAKERAEPRDAESGRGVEPVPEAALRSLESDGPKLRRRSRGAMIAGIAMVSVGPLALLGSLAARSAQESCDEELENDYPDHRVPTSQQFRVERCDSYSAPMWILGLSGGVLTLTGIPLIIYGARSVPEPGPPRGASLQAAPFVTRGAAGLRLELQL